MASQVEGIWCNFLRRESAWHGGAVTRGEQTGEHAKPRLERGRQSSVLGQILLDLVGHGKAYTLIGREPFEEFEQR